AHRPPAEAMPVDNSINQVDLSQGGIDTRKILMGKDVVPSPENRRRCAKYRYRQNTRPALPAPKHKPEHRSFEDCKGHYQQSSVGHPKDDHEDQTHRRDDRQKLEPQLARRAACSRRGKKKAHAAEEQAENRQRPRHIRPETACGIEKCQSKMRKNKQPARDPIAQAQRPPRPVNCPEEQHQQPENQNIEQSILHNLMIPISAMRDTSSP